MKYKPDNGPLTDDQIEQIRKLAKPYLPTGKVITKETLFAEPRTNEFPLNRKQIEKLTKLAEHFTEVEWFTLVADEGVVSVHFNLFGDDDKDTDANINITDVSTW